MFIFILKVKMLIIDKCHSLSQIIVRARTRWKFNKHQVNLKRSKSVMNKRKFMNLIKLYRNLLEKVYWRTQIMRPCIRTYIINILRGDVYLMLYKIATLKFKKYKEFVSIKYSHPRTFCLSKLLKLVLTRQRKMNYAERRRRYTQLDLWVDLLK